MNPTPICVLTGFLGSGKTTALRRALEAPHMADTLVVINEAGEASIDHLIVKHVAPGVVQLANGCLCCTIRRDIGDTLAERIEARDRGETPQFSRIVLETSGLAEPAEILSTLAADPLIEPLIRLNRVVAVIDAVHGDETLATRVEAIEQAAVADVLLLSKTDLQAPTSALLARLRDINPAAALRDLSQANALDDALFADAPRVAQAFERPRLRAKHGVDVISLELTRAPTRFEFAREFGGFAARHGGALLRMKAILRFADAPDRVATLHAVRHTLHTPEWLPEWPDVDARARLVLIGSGIGMAAFIAEVPCVAAKPWCAPALARPSAA